MFFLITSTIQQCIFVFNNNLKVKSFNFKYINFHLRYSLLTSYSFPLTNYFLFLIFSYISLLLTSYLLTSYHLLLILFLIFPYSLPLTYLPLTTYFFCFLYFLTPYLLPTYFLLIPHSSFLFPRSCLKPLLPFKKPKHSKGGSQHDSPHNKIPMCPVQFGDIHKIGTIDAHNKSNGDKYD